MILNWEMHSKLDIETHRTLEVVEYCRNKLPTRSVCRELLDRIKG